MAAVNRKYEFNPTDLTSVDQRTVAIALSQLLIEDKKAGYSDAVLVQLEKLRNIAWLSNENNDPKTNTFTAEKGRKKNRKDDVERAVGALENPQDKIALAEAYARLGHLYEVAGHIARNNFFIEREAACVDALGKMQDKKPEDKKLDISQVVPGGLNQLLFAQKNGEKNPFTSMSVKDVVKKLSTPVGEYVFTQHPTNTNLLASMKLQREIAKHADRMARGHENALADLQSSIEAFAKTPLIKEDNIKAKDETEVCVNFLENAYHDIERLYYVADTALARKFGAAYDDTQRSELDLKVRFGSWGSAGDKDGNSNIKSENTLEAIIMHKQKAAELLARSLRDAQVEHGSPLAAWEAKFDNAQHKYKELFQKIEAVRNGGNDIPLTREQFADISKSAHDISQELGDAKSFMAELKKAASSANAEKQQQLLAIERKVRVFGFNLGKIEYRETAEEYARVINVLIATKQARDTLGNDKDGRNFAETFIACTDPAERADRIKQLLEDPHKCEAWAKIAREFIASHDASSKEIRDYAKNDDNRVYAFDELKKGDAAIVYHTLRRMELARDFDEMITHNVLAEAQGVESLMEALALQFAVAKDGKRAMLNVVPLFEEAETMAKIPNVIKDGLANDVYRKHVEDRLKEDKKTDPEAKLTQQIQIAHSDNARRAGAIGSRGIIHEGHAAARVAMDEYNKDRPEDQKVILQFFEGGSLSDSYRNGVRAHTAMIEDFGMGSFAKFTFQGGDLLNYFNQATSMERLLTRGIVKQVELLESGAVPAAGLVATDKDPLEKAVRAMLAELQNHYDNFYDKQENSNNPLGRLLHALDYRRLEKAGNAGTRGNRGATPPEGEDISGIDSSKLRTIAFSMGFQHNGLHPSCIGIESMLSKLSGQLRNPDKESKIIPLNILRTRFEAYRQRKGLPQGLEPVTEKQELTPEGLKYLYDEGSKAFRDAIDKMAYSLYNTDIELVKQTIDKYHEKHGKTPGEGLDSAFDQILTYYTNAANVVHTALSGTRFELPHKNDKVEVLARAIYAIKQLPALEHLETVSYKQRFVEGVRAIAGKVEEAIGGASEYIDRLMYNARATLYHGRTFPADDPTFRAAYMGSKPEKSPAAGMAI